MPLTPQTLRALIAVDGALQSVHHALDCALRSLSRLRDLEGVAELADLLARFKDDLHDAHPIERYMADLTRQADEADVLPFLPAPQSDSPDAIDLRD
jgi:hypothetical protein